MKFSERYFAEEKFRLHCYLNGLNVCVLNFLSWLHTTDDGRVVAKQICEEIRKEGDETAYSLLARKQKDRFCNEHCILVEGVGHCYLDCKYTSEDIVGWTKEKEKEDGKIGPYALPSDVCDKYFTPPDKEDGNGD